MTVSTIDDLINCVFPDLTNEQLFESRAILASRNDEADEINAMVVQRLSTSEHEYASIDSVSSEDGTYYPIEFLNTLNPSGMPLHRLSLKVGSPIIMLRNLTPADGLCNGTRLICRQFSQHVIDAEIVNGAQKGKRVFIPRKK